MFAECRSSLMAEGTHARDPSPRENDDLEAWDDGNAIRFIPAERRKLRVLIADDSPDTADTMAMLVGLWGHDVCVAHDGAATLEMAYQYRPDVLLMDIAMPKLNGFEVAAQLRRQTRIGKPLLVCITGYADVAHRLLWEKGFDHIFIKPVDPEIVEDLLRLEQNRLALSIAANARRRRRMEQAFGA